MKKSALLIMLILIIGLSACNVENNQDFSIKELTTVHDIEKLGINCFNYCGYLFFSYNGANVVAQTDADGKTLKKVEKYEMVTPDDAAFDNLEEGMTVFDLVEKVGLPKGSYTSGMISLFFETNDGENTYTVYLEESNAVGLVIGKIVKST